MYCYEPSGQVFNLQDKIIGIDFGKSGDKSVQATFRKGKDGLTLIEIKELNKN